jgi:Tfp pilus assembly major pilin PilA
MCKYAISAIYLQKYKKYSEKSDYVDGFCLQSELNLTLFYMIEGHLE